MHIRKLPYVLAFSAFLTSSALGQFQKPNKPSTKKDHHTRVQLLADVKSIQPGVPFSAGILMMMEKDWHTYWKNAGEAGLSTEIKWTLPDGFVAGEIQWPLPHKYNESGDVLTYGYADETMLLVQITPSNTLKPNSTVLLKAEVSWLECEKLCVPGDANVELKLKIASGESENVNGELFAKYISQIPKPFLTGNGVSFTSNVQNGKIELLFKTEGDRTFDVSEGNAPDFYPESFGDLTVGRTVSVADARSATMTVSLTALEKLTEPIIMRGVVVYRFEGGEKQAATVEVQLPKELVATIPLDGSSSSETALLDQKFTTIESEQSRQPLYMYILFAVIGGLLLNIMPCVLPVISLKIFGLMKMAGDKPIEVKKSGWFFSLGILASFLSLALVVIVLKSAGQLVGWGFQFQEPLFIIAMTTVVFAFGLSLFGVYEINLPSSLMQGAAKTDEKKGFLAPFSEGIFATILATPCTAPILGTALGFAFSQPAYVVILIFSATAFGMALPYLILTAKPAWMKYLPKPGNWMVAAKQFMGFLMMATMLWLLQILGSQLGMEAVIWTSAFLLFVGISCWLIGTFATLTATRAKYFGTWALAIAVVLVGYKLFVGDILKARDVLSKTEGLATSASGETDGIAWQPFTVDQLESHLRANKPVFIDFTAEWCLTCKVNEKTVLADQSIIAKLKEKDIVTMKADWTNRNETITRLLQKFGRSGVPLYVLFPAGKPTEPIVLPEVITTGIVMDALEKAR